MRSFRNSCFTSAEGTNTEMQSQVLKVLKYLLSFHFPQEVTLQKTNKRDRKYYKYK